MKSLALSSRKYLLAASTALREKLAYPGNFAGSILTYGLFIFIFSRVWAGAYASRSEIAGYTRDMMVWYFIIAEIPSFGFGRYFAALSPEMKSGDVAYIMSRPYSFLGYSFASRMGGSLADAALVLAEGILLGLILAGPLPAFAAAAGLGGLAENALRWLAVLVSLLLSGTLNFFLQFSLAMTAFWFEENEAFYWIYQKLALIVGTLVPIEFLPAAIERVAWFTPFPYVAYAPAHIMVAFSPTEALGLVCGQLAWIAVAMLLAKAVFARGSRKLSVNGG
jgi:ABC-2 type transport system permease protein